MSENEDKTTSEKNTPTSGRPQIKIKDEVATGVYANLAIIHHNESELVLDFVYLEPQRPQGQVASRVITSPRAAKRLLHTLEKSVKSYEEKFGPIPLPQKAVPKGSYH